MNGCDAMICQLYVSLLLELVFGGRPREVPALYVSSRSYRREAWKRGTATAEVRLRQQYGVSGDLVGCQMREHVLT